MSESKPMTEDELVSVCLQEISRGIGGSAGDGNEDMSLALDYYHGRLPGISKSESKDTRASKYVSMDVMDGIEATVAEIMPSFDSEEIAFYEPNDADDEDQAELESRLVNYLFFEKYDGWTLLQELTKDALLHRNCTAKVWWDERAEVEYEEYENVDPMMLPQIMQPTKDKQQVEIVEEIRDEDDEEGDMEDEMQMAMMSGQPISIRIKRTTLVGKPAIRSEAPENVIVNGDHNSPYLHNARFVATEMTETVSNLIAQGYDPELVAKIPEHNTSQVSNSRNNNGDNTYGSAHASTKLVQVFECFILVDYDGDGIAERRKVVIGGGGVLLGNDPWKSVSLIGGVAILMPHKYRGISLFDRLKEIQDTKTPIIRSMVNGTALAANPRLGVITGEVNMDDLMTSRTGGIVRMTTPGSVFDLAKAEVPASSYSLMQFMDQQRRERGGGAIGAAGQATKAQGQGGDFSLDRIMTSMELTNAIIAKSLGETIVRGIFIQLHALIRENHQGEIQAKVGGTWMKSAPAEWQERPSVRVMIGASHAERARQAQTMQSVVMMQRELAQSGSIMFSEDKAYAAITDAIQLSGIKSPDRYLVDPSSDEGKQASEGKSKQTQEQKMQEMQVQMEMIKAQMGLAEAEKMKGQAAIMSQQIKAENENLKNELEQMKAIVKAADMSDQTEFKYVQHQDNMAMKLTALEAEYARELSQQNEANYR
jgi:hypothetical protein